MKTAVIMAAGLGTRFGKYTELIPKGFVEYKGKAMVIRSIETLIDCGIERIIIGTGYHKEKFEALRHIYPQVECVFSPRFAETNSMYTLYNCREAVGDDDFLLLESDLVFERRAISELVDCRFDNAMLISPVFKFQDQYYVRMNENSELVDCSTDRDAFEPSGELVGIHKLSNTFYKTVISEYSRIVDEKPKLGYEFQLLRTSQKGVAGVLDNAVMNVLRLDGLQWYEIDDENDLAWAETNVNLD